MSKRSKNQKTLKLLYKKIIVPDDFEVENGVLGLHQYIYLNIIQFLDSSIVRKV
jgi:hypothetical protein